MHKCEYYGEENNSCLYAPDIWKRHPSFKAEDFQRLLTHLEATAGEYGSLAFRCKNCWLEKTAISGNGCKGVI
jgi:hypothetical protein